MQTKSQSFFEATINILVGYGIATLANWIVIPWFGYNVSFAESAGIGFFLTFISLTRSYLLRRFFNWYHTKLNTG